MTYKKHVLILSAAAAVLGLLYAGTLILTPERLNSRNAAYTWLEPKWTDHADRIEISGERETLTLVRQNAVWYVETEGAEYPAKQGRVDDLLRLLSRRGAYPVRGSAASSHERLGLGGNASRIVVRGGPGAAPLLDLLVGGGDATGREVYLRKNGQNEVRSGEDLFSVYLSPSPSPWYNLRLFPQDGAGALSLDSVQRVTAVSPPPEGETSGEDLPSASLVITRSGSGWTVEGVAADALDSSQIDPYIRAILDAEGDGFAAAVTAEDPVFTEGRIHLELGDGATRTIRLGAALPSAEEGAGKRIVTVSGSPYVYTLAEWTVNRLFRDAASFRKQEEP
ncbi:MAG: DUF4340 domain-containing protein [Spirochaetaceae bacterium]|jgi:hypothetical protein|nr:DUF4340 domain-containing protein [Spirochaetaceae bacterium]